LLGQAERDATNFAISNVRIDHNAQAFDQRCFRRSYPINCVVSEFLVHETERLRRGRGNSCSQTRTTESDDVVSTSV